MPTQSSGSNCDGYIYVNTNTASKEVEFALLVRCTSEIISVLVLVSKHSNQERIVVSNDGAIQFVLHLANVRADLDLAIDAPRCQLATRKTVISNLAVTNSIFIRSVLLIH